jgi:integrase
VRKSGGGTGSVFLVKGSDIYHYKFYKDGECFRGSTEKRTESEARKVLADKLFDAGAGKLETSASRKMTLTDLSQLVFADYEKQGYDSLARQEDAFNWLAKFFGARCPVASISSHRLEEYVRWRPTQADARSLKRKLSAEDYKNSDGTLRPPRIGCSRATINRELSFLRHAFELAKRQRKLMTAPYIQTHKERNRRMGIFTFQDFIAVRDYLPAYLRPAVTVSFYTGWRLASELLTRKKSHLVDGWLVLEAEEAKNDEPRRFPLDLIPELREVVEAQLATTRELEMKSGRVIDLLFHRDGNRVVDYRPAWTKACDAAGLTGKLAHDFRRTAATNLINSGVDPLTTMALVGWKDISMLKRYRIIQDEPLKRAVEKLNLHLAAQKKQPAKIISIAR